MQQYFKDLGLEQGKDYSPEDIKKAWRAKCLINHPDKGGDKEKFIRVTHAYKMLTDPSYRIEEEDKSKKHVDLTLRIQVPVNFFDWVLGKSCTISYNRVELTPTGEAVVKTEQEILTVTIDLSQVPTAKPYAVPEYGLRCGEEVGDAIFTIMPGQHPRFKIEGSDIVTMEQVPLEVMLKGGTIEVQTVYGIKSVHLKPATVPGARAGILECGVRRLGCHVAVLNPIYPTQQDLKEKEAWKALDINWENHEEQKKQIEDFEQLFLKLKFNL